MILTKALTLTLLYGEGSFLDIVSNSFFSIGDKIEVGAEITLSSSLKFQSDIFADSHDIDFYNETGTMSAIYLSLKSKAFSNSWNLGFYFNSTIEYSNFSKQRPLFGGSIYNKTYDIDTSVNIVSFDLSPSLFYFIDFSSNGRNTVVLELFSGAGITAYTGRYREFRLPTKEEYDSMKDEVRFTRGENGETVFLGESEDLGFGYGINFSYGLKLKYIYQNFNIHLIYKTPFVVTADKHLNISYSSVGVGYSF